MSKSYSVSFICGILLVVALAYYLVNCYWYRAIITGLVAAIFLGNGLYWYIHYRKP